MTLPVGDPAAPVPCLPAELGADDALEGCEAELDLFVDPLGVECAVAPTFWSGAVTAETVPGFAAELTPIEPLLP